MTRLVALALVLVAAPAIAAPRTKVKAVALTGPSADRDAACAAWKPVESATGHAIRCYTPEADEAPVTGLTRGATQGKPEVFGALPIFGEGLDIHCGLAVITAAGVFMPPAEGLIGCGSARSKSSWDLRQKSLAISKLDNQPVVIWVVAEQQTLDPANFYGTGKPKTYRATNVAICRGGTQPACALIRRDGDLSLAKILGDITIDWP